MHDRRTRSVSVTTVIADHREAYVAYAACRARLWALHDTFDPDYEVQGLHDVMTFLATRDAPGDAVLTRTYIDEETACLTTSQAEDAAWQTVAALVPTTPADLRQWLAYVIEHSAKEDEVVTLQDALKHVCDLLADRLEGGAPTS